MRRAAAIFVVSLITVAALGETGKPRTDLNLRRAPTARTSNVITVLRTSDELEILETKRGWYRVRVAKTGVEGWVAKKHVRLISADAPKPAVDTSPASGSGRGMATVVIVALLVALLALIGYVAGHQPAGGVGSSSLTGMKQNPVPALMLSLLIGTLYVGLTLPKALTTVGTERGWDTLAGVGQWSMALNRAVAAGVPAFPALMQYVFWAMLLYLLSLLLLAVRHGRLELFGWGAGTLSCSVVIFHIIAWVGYIVVKVVTFVLWVVGSITRFLGNIFIAILGFLARVVIGIGTWVYGWLHQLLGEFWWLVPAGIGTILVIALLRSRRDASDILKTLVRVSLFVVGAGIGFYVVRWIWSLIKPWAMVVLEFLGSVIVFLGALFMRLIAGIAIALALATVGQLLLDQIQGALSAGRRRRGVVIGAIAIGTSVAILLLISNIYGVITWLPDPAMEFAGKYLHQPAPIFDAVIAFGIVALSIVGVWRNVPVLGEEPTMQEFGKSLVYAILGVFLNGALVAIATQTEE